MTFLIFALLSNVFVACVLALIASLVGWAGRRAALAHLLWLAVFVKLITPPILSAPVSLPPSWLGQIAATQQFFEADLDLSFYRAGPVAPSQRTAMASSLSSVSSSDAQEAALPTADRNSRPAVSVGACLIGIWLLGTVSLILRGVWRFVRFSRLLRREGSLDAEASQVVRQLLNRGEAEFSPPVCRIAARVSPMLFGVARATWIVCPNSLWTSLSDSQRRAFVAHEVAHYQRRDHWVRWLEWLVTAIYWWMPLIYLARIQLERHEEAACDALALKQLDASPRSYAETLLSVVDFLSETRTGAPRLASRMQPTASLEERLRLIMLWQPPQDRMSKQSVMLVASCMTLLVIHPTLLPHSPRFAESGLGQSDTTQVLPPARASGLLAGLQPTDGRAVPLVSLPPAPTGWWNATPSRTWADRVLGESELRLLAQVGIGIGVSLPGGSPFSFNPDNVRSIVYLPPSGRLVIGTSSGELHLWDARAQQSVSFIGKHNACVTSLAYHPSGGLISGDEAGSLIAWEIRSGQMLATRSFDGPIGSVRWSSDGTGLSVLVGGWSSDGPAHQMHLLNPESLETLQSIALPSTIAVVAHHAELGWLAVDWSGIVWSLTEGYAVDKLKKQLVSGAVMCQDLFSITAASHSGSVPSVSSSIPASVQGNVSGGNDHRDSDRP